MKMLVRLLGYLWFTRHQLFDSGLAFDLASGHAHGACSLINQVLAGATAVF